MKSDDSLPKVVSIYESQVSCLSSIRDLQRQCISQNVQLSSETNRFLVYSTLVKIGPDIAQKAVSKLVAAGKLKWNEQDFEVEKILDYCQDEGVDFYLIKWKGWSTKHNTWEPEANLDCIDLIEEFHIRNKTGRIIPESVREKRKFEEIDDGDERETKRSRIDDLFRKLISCNDNISPMTLISQTSPDKTSKSYNGVMNCTGLKVPKFNNSKVLLNPRTKAYKQKKVEILSALKEWEKHLNTVNTDPAPITVENTVDLEGPPENFEYINDYKAGPGIVIPDDPVIGCECEDCYSEKKGCCAAQFGVEFAYFKWKRLRVTPGRPIYECNKRCKCGPECPNRVVQQGRKHKVCVFRTSNSRGWGVKALQKIKAGTFVMEYVGEVISNEEAEIRGKTYDSVGRTYLFDLDFNGDDCPFTVDAAVYGNVSHFVNHSCDPNLEVYSVWINTLDPRLPRIALFSRRDIEKGEELTFDYMSSSVHSKLTQEQENDLSNKPTAVTDSNTEALPADGEATKTFVPSTQSESSVAVKTTEPGPQGDNAARDPATGNTAGDETASDPGVEPCDPAHEDSKDDLVDQVSEMGDAAVANSSESKEYRMVCQCGAKNCRKFVF